MSRPALSRPVRVGAAAASVAGLVLLAGCGAETESPDAAAEPVAPGADYADGTYTADGSYQTPESVETVSVTLTLADGVVTEVEVTGDPQARESEQYQGLFIGGIADEVVGKSLDDIEVDRVAGSSLTSGGFNAAVQEIRTEAAG
ncbi:FMN-binding protein [Microbacterium sp.]|uniref:FMN-binding protein n=1 Tax=Microbacterium sp. TaxID=51671 RepID=UPI0037362D90